MREIKFRQYLKERGWHYFELKDGQCFGVVSDAINEYPIMQYTGLKDKNGKEIYEGDILQIYDEEDFSAFEVIFYDGMFCRKYSHKIITELHHSIKMWTIIGNIYENQELLNDIK